MKDETAIKPFDYTKWRQDNLLVDMSVDEISKEAMKLRKSELGINSELATEELI